MERKESLRAYLTRQLPLVESDLFSLAHRYGVRDVRELHEAVREGRFQEAKAF